MALTGPVLDDRTFEQLRAELVRRIPVYAPEWTDHNESDPGIALLELFAHLGESLLFRFNQIPDATQVAFLRLLGVQPRPAQVAQALLVLTTERPGGVQVLAGREAKAGAVAFQTDDEVYAWPLTTHAVGKVEAPELPEDLVLRAAEQHRRQDALERLPDGPRAAAGTVGSTYYEVQAVPDEPGDGALDVSATLDRSLWVALLARSPAAARDLRTSTPLPDGVLFLGVALDEIIEPPVDLSSPTGAQTGLVSAAELLADPPAVQWELWTPPAGVPPRPSALEPLTMVGDTSRGLTTTGVVELVIPHAFVPLSPPPVTDGGLTDPPPLDDEELAGRVVAWLRARRPLGENDGIHRIRWVGLNCVEASQARTAPAELLGTGTGEPGQAYRLSQRPVVRGTVRLEVEELDGWRPWTEVDPATAGGPRDRYFSVDLSAGEVRFGSRSMAPQIGSRIRVVSYRHGGGLAGNVPAGAITSLSGVTGVTVTNPLPAAGGADAASLPDALDALPAHVQRRDRLVTAEDLEALTLEVPGVRRAVPLPLVHPDDPRQDAAGVMSVVVFPDEDLRDPGAPLPDTSLLRRVAAYLNPRRLVTTELYVVPPTYRRIAVAVGVHVADGYQVDAVRRWVELLLRQYLGPLPPCGPAGNGWPLGRAVRRAELEAVAVQVEGVEYVEDELRLARRDDATGAWTPSPLVELERWEAPALDVVTVVPGPPLVPGEGYDPPADPDQPVLVPLPPEVC